MIVKYRDVTWEQLVKLLEYIHSVDNTGKDLPKDLIQKVKDDMGTEPRLDQPIVKILKITPGESNRYAVDLKTEDRAFNKKGEMIAVPTKYYLRAHEILCT